MNIEGWKIVKYYIQENFKIDRMILGHATKLNAISELMEAVKRRDVRADDFKVRNCHADYK